VKSNIFISYSRREIGFVDDLVHKLEQKEYQVWLDYRNLIPGSPWKDQIYQAIHSADAILLVVSKASISSQNVEVEWRHVLEQGKRVILLIFEAVDLPPELEKYEWVDFRGNYQAGLTELFAQLKQPIVEKHPAPETGFKVPGIVWLAALMGALAGILSLYVFWTLFIPWLLAPLALRIFKRDFNFIQVQSALWILPVVLYISAMSMPDEAASGNLVVLSLLSLPLVIVLLFILRSPAMQRWGKEQATLPVFSKPSTHNAANPIPVSFYIDHASEDRKIAVELTSALKKHGHTQSGKMENAQSVLVLLSRFKTDTQADPERQYVFPIILQTAQVSKKLSRIQWIDLRTGPRTLDLIAKLLSEPENLLRAMGNRPRGDQLILPAPVTAMYYFLLLIGIFAVGSFLKLFFGLMDSGMPTDVFVEVISSIIFSEIIIFALTMFFLISMIRSLLRRQGMLASFWRFALALMMLGIILFWQLFQAGEIINMSQEFGVNTDDMMAINAIILPMLTYIIGGVILAAFLVFRRRDILLWFPARKA